MNKLLVLIFIFGQPAVSQERILQTPLLKGSYSGMTFTLTPNLKGLTEECMEYSKYLFENAANLTAWDVNFYRSLPMRGVMKNTIEVDFRIQNEPIPASGGALAGFDASSLQKLTPQTQSSNLSEISKRFGLEVPLPEYHKYGPYYILRVKSRDLLCDMLSNKTFFAASAQVSVSRNESESTFLKLFYADISDATYGVLSTNEKPLVKAALLGLAYSEVFKKHNLEVNETRSNLSYLFDTIFKSGSLELIKPDIQQTRTIGLTPIFLKTGVK